MLLMHTAAWLQEDTLPVDGTMICDTLYVTVPEGPRALCDGVSWRNIDI